MQDHSISLVRVTQSNLIDFINQAKQRVIIAKTGYFANEIEKLQEVISSRPIKCKLFIEAGDQAVRFGFGDAKALEMIKNKPDLFDLVSAERIRMAILVVDDNALIFAPHINFMEKDSAKVGFPNGVFGGEHFAMTLLNEITKLEDMERDECQEIGDNGIFMDGKLPQKDKKEVIDQINKDIDALSNNPPIDPGRLQRINFYRNNYKIVKVYVHGVKIRSKKISLRPFLNLLKDKNERLLRSWMIFSSEDIEMLEDARTFDAEKSIIVSQYLIDAGRHGHIMDVTNRKDFDHNIKNLIEEYIAYHKGEEVSASNRFIKVVSQTETKRDLKTVLESSRKALASYLYEISDSDSNFVDKMFSEKRYLKKIVDNNSIMLNEAKERFIDEFIDDVLKFPLKDEMIGNIKYKIDYYDISDELIEDQEFIDIIAKNKDIQIRQYSEGYERIE